MHPLVAHLTTCMQTEPLGSPSFGTFTTTALNRM